MCKTTPFTLMLQSCIFVNLNSVYSVTTLSNKLSSKSQFPVVTRRLMDWLASLDKGRLNVCWVGFFFLNISLNKSLILENRSIARLSLNTLPAGRTLICCLLSSLRVKLNWSDGNMAGTVSIKKRAFPLIPAVFLWTSVVFVSLCVVLLLLCSEWSDSCHYACHYAWFKCRYPSKRSDQNQ